MESIATLVTEVGSFGVLLALAGFIIYNHFKTDTKKDNALNELKATLESNTAEIKGSIKGLDNRISNLETNVSNDMSALNKRISDIECGNPVARDVNANKASHTKQFADRLKLGPQLHKTLNTFRARINADHIFIGSFHNGNESITGIPYYKFDIIAERFRPDKVDRDIEFAFIYKDADLLRHDLLPQEVVQCGTVHYIIDENNESYLSEIDDIIYRRMLGRDIKQLAVSLLRDPDGTPSGFVGCVKYDYEKLDITELKECGLELEQIYATNDKMVMKNLNKLN
jgi:hypothetical protein